MRKKILIKIIAAALLMIISGVLLHTVGQKKSEPVVLLPDDNETYIFDEIDYLDDDAVVEINIEDFIEETPTESSLSYSKLHQKNSDVVGIVFIGGCNIDEPVVLSKNDYYLRTNLYGQYSKGGTAYIKNCDINSTNMTIYAHTSTYIENFIFSNLAKYKDQEFYYDNSIVTFITKDEIRLYEIFSVRVIPADSDDMEFTQSEWRNNAAFSKYLEKTVDGSRYNTGVTVDSGDKIITLVTCNQSNLKQRIIVSAKLISNQPY